ncbi:MULTISPECIES: sigma-70 family RNA polymerase sigma factor [Bacillus amyloliquefaciens group]|uniref:sigma-70 family RNA polymerase sigma factor n=1 Tax=Bacillus amyloliquefaciens group TaxID=1938374 RepID=UPI001F0D905B|nr:MULTISPECIES: sigma-70 family RNA polymerase sigma factor [Bacillus amyloliquefaciens group]MED2998567.1 sigma-70 family RNA polymerase sigma factor [Bacillus velezensis]UMU15115.1 sigma-70 family RNA polymerase sigma factor [Bacillus velezensis]WHM11755.1 sigma-70 family RNA polymerase sigma factor [Bacillus velezensis]WIX27462.1 sigma-70 family RNA polymerase sigma factor [Bacillus amyloliquefaciens]
MQDLIIEYKSALKDVKKMYRQLSAVADSLLTAEQKRDKKIIGGMINDLEYTIEWLQKGRQPGARRGADHREVYKRTILSDPRLIDALPEEYAIIQEPDGEVSDWDRERIADALSVLTDREKDIFMMHAVQNMSFEEIAALLNIKKGTVQKNIERSRLKMKNRANDSLFCLS